MQDDDLVLRHLRSWIRDLDVEVARMDGEDAGFRLGVLLGILLGLVISVMLTS